MGGLEPTAQDPPTKLANQKGGLEPTAQDPNTKLANQIWGLPPPNRALSLGSVACPPSRATPPSSLRSSLFAGHPFLLGYLLLRHRKVTFLPPGFLVDQDVSQYNYWDQRPVVVSLQQLVFMGVCSFFPPPCHYFHEHPSPVPSLRSPIIRIWLLHLRIYLHHQQDVRSTNPADSSLATFLLASNFTLPGGRAYTPAGGEKGPRKRSPPPGALINSGKPFQSSATLTGSPRRAATKSKDITLLLPRARFANQSYLSLLTPPPRQSLLSPLPNNPRVLLVLSLYCGWTPEFLTMENPTSFRWRRTFLTGRGILSCLQQHQRRQNQMASGGACHLLLSWSTDQALSCHASGLPLCIPGFPHPRGMGYQCPGIHVLLWTLRKRQFLPGVHQLQASTIC